MADFENIFVYVSVFVSYVFCIYCTAETKVIEIGKVYDRKGFCIKLGYRGVDIGLI